MTPMRAEVILKEGETRKHSDYFGILGDCGMQELQRGGVNLKRRCIGKKLSALCLGAAAAVMLTAAVTPGTVWAEETAAVEHSAEMNSENTGGEPGQGQVIGSEKEAGGVVSENPDTEKNGQADGLSDENQDVTAAGNADEITGGEADAGAADPGQTTEQDAVYPVLIPLESGEQYEQLSAFLSLSADQFKAYIIMFVDAGQNPAQPEGETQITLPVPAEYDMSRVVVSEITMAGNTPQRTELSYTAGNGNVVFQTDHAGLFVVMEKKVQAELPPSLEMTDKVENLELTKYESSAAAGTVSSVPKTGDERAGFLWMGLSSAVSTGLILLVIVKSMKISKKS